METAQTILRALVSSRYKANQVDRNQAWRETLTSKQSTLPQVSIKTLKTQSQCESMLVVAQVAAATPKSSIMKAWKALLIIFKQVIIIISIQTSRIGCLWSKLNRSLQYWLRTRRDSRFWTSTLALEPIQANRSWMWAVTFKFQLCLPSQVTQSKVI
jgi:hypothetical protein